MIVVVIVPIFRRTGFPAIFFGGAPRGSSKGWDYLYTSSYSGESTVESRKQAGFVLNILLMHSSQIRGFYDQFDLNAVMFQNYGI